MAVGGQVPWTKRTPFELTDHATKNEETGNWVLNEGTDREWEEEDAKDITEACILLGFPADDRLLPEKPLLYAKDVIIRNRLVLDTMPY